MRLTFKKMLCCSAFMIWMGMGLLHLHAQTQEKRFYHLTIQDGLSQSTVQAILQDYEGYMWFGTQDGLNRYDGYDITVYRHDAQNPNSISHNDVRVLYEDRQQNLWIGTQARGLVRYDRDKDQFIRYRLGEPDDWHTISANTIWAMLEDSRDTFWVGTVYGLNKMNREDGTFQRIYHEQGNPNSLSHNQITSMYEDENGVVWVGTANALNRYNRTEDNYTRYETYNDGNGESNIGTVLSIYEDRQGNFWIGTINGLLLFDRENETFTRRYSHRPDDPHSLSGNYINEILEDSHGNLWLGTGSNGLSIFDRDEEIFIRYNQQADNQYSLNNDGIHSLYESDDNILWIGTFAGGVNFHELSPEIFTHYNNEPNNPHSLSSNVVQAFLEDRNGAIWVGTDGGGLNRFDPFTGEFYRVDRGISSDVILDLHETELGIWMATYGEGVLSYNPDTETVVPFRNQPGNPQTISSNYIFEIFESENGYLWFGSNGGGISEYNPVTGSFRYYQINPDDPESTDHLQNNDVRAIYEDSRGDMWFGTYSGYIERLNRDENRFTFYDVNSLSTYYNSVVQAFHEDGRQRLWAATRGAGLLYFDLNSDELHHYLTIDQGLPSNIIHAIVEDEHGHLWLSTNNGISRVNPETHEIVNYNLEHGLQSREFNPGAALMDSEGYIYFGGVNGFNRFHPDSIHTDTTVHNVMFTDFFINNEPVPIGEDSPLTAHINRIDEIILPHDVAVISVGYTALNFSVNKVNEFAYMLEGFDENWNYVGSSRRATYTNLNPGIYTFMVKTSNIDGIWGKSSAFLIIQITPPFWRTGWFISIMVLAVTLLVFALFRMRVQAIRKRNIMLEKEVRVRTFELQQSNQTKNKLFSIIAHDMRNILSGIVGWAGLLKESSEADRKDEVKEYAVYLHQATLQFSDFLKNLLDWSRSQTDQFQSYPRNFSLSKLMESVVSHEQLKVRDKNIVITTTLEPETQIYADPDLMSGVFRNLINNAVKFTEDGGEVEISAEKKDEETVKISISDNGVGMSSVVIKKLLRSDEYHTTKGTSGERGTGLGFGLCKSFVNRNGGTIEIESEPGKGTTIHVFLPAAKTEELITD